MTANDDYNRGASDRAIRLADLMIDGLASSDDAAELSRLIAADEAARQAYLQYVELHGRLAWSLSFPEPIPAARLAVGEAPNDEGATQPTPSSWIEPALAWARKSGDFLGRPMPFSWMAAAVVVAAALVTMATLYFPKGENSGGPDATVGRSNKTTAARLNDLFDCVWANGAAQRKSGDAIAAGDRLELIEGTANVVFSDGATVVLHGRSSLHVNSGHSATLVDGRLTANVPQRAIGFTVSTSAATIVDLGTRFGVAAEKNGDAYVYVFVGSVAVEAKNDKQAKRRIVEAGESLRVEYASGSIDDVADVHDQTEFFRSLLDDKPGKPIVSHFNAPSEFPGTARDGWRSEWQVTADDAQLQLIGPRIESANPLSPVGGSYLTMLARGGGDRRGIVTLARRYDDYDRFALWQPRVVRFSIRLDTPMPTKDDEADYCLTITEKDMSLDPTRHSSESWAMRVYAVEDRGVEARHWLFYDGEGPKMVDSGMEVVVGRTYRVAIQCWPNRSEWSAVVSDGKTTVETDRLLGRKLQSRCPLGAEIGVLNVSARVGKKDQSLGFSLDDVSVGALHGSSDVASPSAK